MISWMMSACGSVDGAAGVQESDEHGELSGWKIAFDQRQEFAAQAGILEEGAVHDTVDHLRVHVLDAAPLHAEMVRFHHHRQAVRLHFFLQHVGQLDHGFFLDLRTAHDPVGDARVLGQADQRRMLVGHHADPDLADDRAQVVRAGAAHRDRADDHQLVQVRRRWGIRSPAASAHSARQTLR
jgi:hypothetical protein